VLAEVAAVPHPLICRCFRSCSGLPNRRQAGGLKGNSPPGQAGNGLAAAARTAPQAGVGKARRSLGPSPTPSRQLKAPTAPTAKAPAPQGETTQGVTLGLEAQALPFARARTRVVCFQDGTRGVRAPVSSPVSIRDRPCIHPGSLDGRGFTIPWRDGQPWRSRLASWLEVHGGRPRLPAQARPSVPDPPCLDGQPASRNRGTLGHRKSSLAPTPRMDITSLIARAARVILGNFPTCKGVLSDD
jgi:hypothetical protein